MPAVAEIKNDYLSDTATAGILEGASLEELPLSATVVTSAVLSDQGARVLSDVVKNDASIGEDYAPVGYYGDFQIRGIPIDLATGLQINGMTIAGEQDVPLENKESVEFVKGIAGIESGVASAGGLIDYVTKQPVMIEAMEMATDHRGSSYGTVDLGHLFGSRKQGGARVNLAGEEMQSYVNDANGWRAMGAGAADWKIGTKAILKGDFEYQHKVQRSVCGYQLLGGTTVPDLTQVYPSTMLGEQSWAKPNTFDTFNTGARLDYDLPRSWLVFAQASFSHSLIDDNVVYAYGNSVASPSYFFAPDGTYDIYDYRNPGELRIDAQAEALVAGHWKTGAYDRRTTWPVGAVVFRRQRAAALGCGVRLGGLGEHLSTHSSVPHGVSTRFGRAARALMRTITNPPLCCRTGCVCRDAFSCWPAAAKTRVRDHNYSGRDSSTHNRDDSGCRSMRQRSTPRTTLRSMATTASCCRWDRRRRGGSITRASFSILSSPARPRWARSTSRDSAFC